MAWINDIFDPTGRDDLGTICGLDAIFIAKSENIKSKDGGGVKLDVVKKVCVEPFRTPNSVS